MPQLLDIGAGYTLRVTALNPTTGALVAGVQVGVVTITSAPMDDAPVTVPLPAALIGYHPGPN
jgi:hypothetical protein